MRLPFLVVFPCAIIAAPSTAAMAESPRDKARHHVEQGDAFKKRAQSAKEVGDDKNAVRLFRKAAKEYQQAYKFVPHPLMLYNQAQVSRLAGDRDQALRLYLEFLDYDPAGDAATFARQYVDILERRVRTDDDGDDDFGDDDDDDDDLGDDDDDDLGDDDEPSSKAPSSKKSSTSRELTEDTSPSSEASGAGLRYSGLGMMAAGAVSVGLGVKFGLDAKSISDCLSTYPSGCDQDFPTGQWTDAALALEEEGSAANQKMFLFTGIGAAAILGGGLLYYLGSKGSSAEEEEEAGLRILPQVERDRVGFSVFQRF